MLSAPSLVTPREKPLKIVLDWFINPDHAPLFVAEQQGFFHQEGVRVELITPSDPADGSKLVAVKQADVALIYQPQLLIDVDNGLPLVRFGTLIDKPLNCLVTLKSLQINSLYDLKGKNLGYSLGNIDEAMLKVMLHSQGLNEKDVNLLNVRFNLNQALLSGRITAFIGGMRNVEPVQLNFLGHPAKLFYPEDYGIPFYEELIFVSHRDAIRDARLIRFLKGLRKGVEYLIKHPEETWVAFVKIHPELNNPVNKAIWLASVSYFSLEPEYLNKDNYQKLAIFMRDQRLINKIPKTSNYALQLF